MPGKDIAYHDDNKTKDKAVKLSNYDELKEEIRCLSVMMRGDTSRY